MKHKCVICGNETTNLANPFPLRENNWDNENSVCCGACDFFIVSTFRSRYGYLAKGVSNEQKEKFINTVLADEVYKKAQPIFEDAFNSRESARNFYSFKDSLEEKEIKIKSIFRQIQNGKIPNQPIKVETSEGEKEFIFE